MVRRWIDQTGVAWPEWEYDSQNLAAWNQGDTLFAWFAWDTSRLSLRANGAVSPEPVDGVLAQRVLHHGRGGAADHEPPSERVAVTSAHEFFLCRLPGDGWSVVAWRERRSGDGPSLASLLAAASGRGIAGGLAARVACPSGFRAGRSP